MVSDPIDAPYRTEANCVIRPRCFSFAEAPKGTWKVEIVNPLTTVTVQLGSFLPDEDTLII